jgi:rod shape-determining protein MreD
MTGFWGWNEALKKYIAFIVLIAFFIFFQSTLFYTNLDIRGVNPDFVLIILSIAAFLLGPMPGQILGFATGLVLDIISGGLLGMTAFTFTIIGYCVGIVGGMAYGRNILISIILLFFVTILKGALLGLVAAIFMERGYFGYFSQGRIFLEAVINCLLTAPLFFIIMRVRRLVTE